MCDDHLTPGQWPDLSDRQLHQRLLRLAERRLWGARHHADDVVSRAIIRWACMKQDTTGQARLEQVIASEVYSLLRSEYRLKQRERRAVNGSNAPAPAVGPDEQHLLRLWLADGIRRQATPMSATDTAVIGLLYEGFTIGETATTLGISRYAVTRSRERWRKVAHETAPDIS